MAQAETTQTSSFHEIAADRRAEPVPGGRRDLRSFFKTDLQMDQPLWERLIGWLRDRDLKARYGRSDFPRRFFELTVSECDEAQVAEFVTAFEPDRHLLVP